MNEINFDSVAYEHSLEAGELNLIATIDGIRMTIPLDPNNRHYAEIMRQVEAGTLTIADAD